MFIVADLASLKIYIFYTPSFTLDEYIADGCIIKKNMYYLINDRIDRGNNKNREKGKQEECGKIGQCVQFFIHIKEAN